MFKIISSLYRLCSVPIEVILKIIFIVCKSYCQFYYNWSSDGIDE